MTVSDYATSTGTQVLRRSRARLRYILVMFGHFWSLWSLLVTLVTFGHFLIALRTCERFYHRSICRMFGLRCGVRYEIDMMKPAAPSR